MSNPNIPTASPPRPRHRSLGENREPARPDFKLTSFVHTVLKYNLQSHLPGTCVMNVSNLGSKARRDDGNTFFTGKGRFLGSWRDGESAQRMASITVTSGVETLGPASVYRLGPGARPSWISRPYDATWKGKVYPYLVLWERTRGQTR